MFIIEQQKTAETCIWEVDNDGDGKVSIGDAVIAMKRIRKDKIGIEPDSFVNLIEFVMYDPTMTGFITCEECMGILAQRSGTTCSESDLRKFIIDSAGASQKKLSYIEFIRQIEARRMFFALRQ